MNKNKLTAILYCITSICFYVVAILNFTSSDKSMGVVYLCLGSSFFCLASMHLSKIKKDDKDDEKENKK